MDDRINTPFTITAAPEVAPQFHELIERHDVPILAYGEREGGAWRYILSQEALEQLTKTEDGQIVLGMYERGELSLPAVEEYADAHKPVVTARPGLPLILLVGLFGLGLASSFGLLALGTALVSRRHPNDAIFGDQMTRFSVDKNPDAAAENHDTDHFKS